MHLYRLIYSSNPIISKLPKHDRLISYFNFLMSVKSIKVKISKLPLNWQQHIYPVYIYSYNSSGDFQDDQHRIQQMLGLGSSESSAGNSSKPTTPRETIVRYMMNEREISTGVVTVNINRINMLLPV
jgi:hypothetical protein